MSVKSSPLRAIVALRYIDGMEQGKLVDAARFAAAPEWQVDRWLNTREPLSLATFRGRIVVAVAFQMLCPGCVAEALPQAQRAAASFAAADVAVIGLHSVFEHHAAQGTPAAPAAVRHEYRIRSAERRVGQEVVSEGRPWWRPIPNKKNKIHEQPIAAK